MYTNLRGPVSNRGLQESTLNIQGAIEDITTNGLGKTSFNGDGQRCLLGSLMKSGNGVKIWTITDIIRLLPWEPSDDDLIDRLKKMYSKFDSKGYLNEKDRETYDALVVEAIDRVASFNDNDSTTAEDVLLILKKLEDDHTERCEYHGTGTDKEEV